MKIAIYKDTFSNNRGADIAVKNLANGLEDRGHSVTLFDKSRFESKIRGDYDVVVSAGTNEILDLAKVEDLPPIVQQFHTDPRYPFRHWIRRWRRNRAIKAALRKVSAFQVLRDSHVETLRKITGVPKGKISVIGNWSSFEGCANALSEEKIILCPGAINADKNQSLLVDAFAGLAREFPGWEVHIYGRGKAKDEAALSRLIAEKGLENRILLKGYADLTEAYSRCSFVAFPSKTEGFGMVILDAAVFAKPTLAREDWIGCGVVVRPDDFAEGLKRFMSDSGYRRSVGLESRRYCHNRYSKEALVDEWERLLFNASSGTAYEHDGFVSNDSREPEIRKE